MSESSFPVPAEVSSGSMTMVSNTETAEQMRESMGLPAEEQEVSDAASKLGKKGAKAAAEARKAKKAEPVVESTDKAEDDEESDEEEAPEPVKAEKKAKTDDEEPDEKAAKPKDEVAQRKQRARERVEEATRKEAEAKRLVREKDAEVQKLKAELETLKAPKAAPAAQTAKAAPDDDPEPDSENAEQYPEGRFDPKYIKDLGRWAARQEDHDRESKRSEKERRDNFERSVKELSSVVDTAIKKAGGEDFLKEMSDDVLTLEPSFFALARGERPTPLNALADEVLRAGEQGPRLMRYLTDHPDVFERVSSLQPHEAAKFERIMGTIEAKLGDATAGAPPPKLEVSKAKPPVRPVTGSPKTDADELGDDSPVSAHVAAWGRRELASQGR